jgi:crotonobetainyl-CoA:carnitine CoA-transferase CaiB-like acyl-CoA transferase
MPPSSEITHGISPLTHWVELFEEAGVPCGPIYTVDQVFADPQVKHLKMAAPTSSRRRGDFHLVASPLNMEGVPKAIRSATPEMGQHTEEILRSRCA